MFRKTFLILLSLVSFAIACEEGIRIAWDFNTLQKIYGKYSFYPRMIRLKNGDILCAFENWTFKNGKILVSILVMRSTDDGQSWQKPITVAQTQNGINPAVPDLIQLNNGYILLAYNPRPPKNNTDPDKYFSIKTSISMDDGNHWMHWSDVYTASYRFNDGCWEPAPIQLPSGEVQVYIANEFPYQQTAEQEITMFRSFDYGYSWSDTVTVGFRTNSRDGMPVPLILQNNQGIVVAIEDNGWGDRRFKPAIIKSPKEDNWHSGPVKGGSPCRWRALKPAWQIPDGEIGAAPYIVQLPSGEVVLSYQGTQGQHPHSEPDAHHVSMFTAIGDAQAKNFSRISEPFQIAANRTAMWNSIFVKNKNTITAITSTTNYSSDGSSEIYAIDGYLFREPEISYTPNISVDGKLSEPAWIKTDSLFIGAYSPTQSRIKMLWNSTYLFIACRTIDRSLWADNQTDIVNDDGFMAYLDTQNKNTSAIQSNIFRFEINLNGNVKLLEGDAKGSWQIKSEEGILASVTLNGSLNDQNPDSGYTAEIAIPWEKIGGRPAIGKKWGICFSLRDDRDGNAVELVENLSGCEPSKPFSYCAVQLKGSLNQLFHPEKKHGNL